MHVHEVEAVLRHQAADVAPATVVQRNVFVPAAFVAAEAQVPPVHETLIAKVV